MRRIPLLVPDVPGFEDTKPYLQRMDVARWYSNFGPLVHEFESALSKHFDGASVATMANCTLGLELSLAALDLPRGARVLMPALTFVATASAVQRAGHEPLLADIDPGSWLLTPGIARAALAGGHIDCVLPVATYGCPHDAAAWDRFTSETGVPVLIDAAGAFGNQQAGKSAHAAYSFHATKALGIGEGGAVVSRDHAFIEHLRRLSNFGINTATGFVARAGTNAKMSEYHAAVGLAALARWPQRSALRREVLAAYAESLARHCPGVRLQRRPADGVYTIMQVLLPEGTDRDRVTRDLYGEGIETRAWYTPVIYDHPAFEDTPAAGGLATVRALAPRFLGLPLHLDLNPADIDWICERLAAALER